VVVSFVASAQMRRLNREYLRHDYATDVLAFNCGSPRQWFADIIICPDTALKAARAYNTAPDDELSLYVTHGMLHLLGYADKTPAQRRVMEEKQNKAINGK
jgi:rRNA maturation RNase YbeY